MSTSTNGTAALETEPALRGILALLVADRQDRAESILGRAGLDPEQVATIAGRDANQVRPQSVIDRARETLTRAAATTSD